MATATKKVSVLLDEADYERFESHCKEQGFKKSTLIAKLIRDYLQDGAVVRETTVGYSVPDKRSKNNK